MGRWTLAISEGTEGGPGVDRRAPASPHSRHHLAPSVPELIAPGDLPMRLRAWGGDEPPYAATSLAASPGS
jgi:hypothetical protein